MFRSKRDVDRYVQEVLRKVKSERERNMRCYHIAVQYFKVHDYEATRRYVCTYLSFKEDSASAHKLLGQALEGLKQKEKALAEYKRSIELENNQPGLILKICELIADKEVHFDMERARYWCERGEDMFPHDPAIFRLKERLLVDQNKDGKNNAQDFEDLISSELKARPDDVGVRIRLLKLYVETGRTQAAFTHAVDLESRQVFRHDLSWYEYLSQLFQIYFNEYSMQVSTDSEFYISWVSALERVVSLSLAENLTVSPKSILECSHAIYYFDQTLHQAYKLLAVSSTGNPMPVPVKLYDEFLKHMSAQLCLHLATFIFKKAKKEQGNWREATRAASPLFLFALTPPPNADAPYTINLRDGQKKMFKLWTDTAAYRICQAGNIVVSLAKDTGHQFVEKVIHTCNNNWRERLYQRLFSYGENNSGVAGSHFVQYAAFSSPPRSGSSPPRYITQAISQLPQHVASCEAVQPGSLHHVVWLGLQSMRHSSPRPPLMLPPADFHTYGFSNLQLTVHNLGITGVETLNRLDIDAFLYAAVLCAGAQLDDEIRSGFYTAERPITLPADITCQLCTPEQAKWWNAAHKLYSKQPTSNNLGDVRMVLQRGIEVVRTIGNHGLDVLLMVQLAHTFGERAKSYSSTPLRWSSRNSEVAALEARANLYWKAALPLLERIERGQVVRTPSVRLFEFQAKPIEPTDVAALIEEGRMFNATQLMRDEEYEAAVEAFKPLRNPYASFHQAEVYKKLSQAELNNCPPDEVTSEMRSKHVILLTKARDALYLTRDRIRVDRQHPLHNVLGSHIGDVESLLSRIEIGTDERGEGGVVLSETSFSPVGSLISPGESAGGDYNTNSSALEMNGRSLNSHLLTSTPKSRHSRHTQQHHSHHSSSRPGVTLQDMEASFLSLEGRLHTLWQTENRIMLERVETVIASQCRRVVDELCTRLMRLETAIDEIRRDMNKLHPDDLYMLGDDEDYTEDVLSFQSSYAAAAQAAIPMPPAAGGGGSYYPRDIATRGVQGTSTVTYGAPPPQFYSSLYQQQPPPPPQQQQPSQPQPTTHNLGYPCQAALPFSEGQQLPDFLRPGPLPLPPAIAKSQSPIPVNVVITTSDTLPTGPPPVQPTLSVTIPPKHRMGGNIMNTSAMTPPRSLASSAVAANVPHEFQISMPASANIPDLQKSPIALQHQREQEDLESDDGGPEIEHDPYPDFKPIIPLPEEVLVTTGEEDEVVLFENRAKLFRFVEREWKERGIGMLKLLQDKAHNKVRLLMRREQVHKVCANHYLTEDMRLTPMVGSDRAWVWLANDFAEEKLQVEKLCAKFKTPDEAERFKEAFNLAKERSVVSADTSRVSFTTPSKDSQPNVGSFTASSTPSPFTTASPIILSPKIKLGGFTFSSEPTLKPAQPKADDKQESAVKPNPISNSPFASFSFAPSSLSGSTALQANRTFFTPPVATQTPSEQKNQTISNILKSPIFATPTGPNLFLNQAATTPSLVDNAAAPGPTATPAKHVNFVETSGDLAQKLVMSAVKDSPLQNSSPKSILKDPQIITPESSAIGGIITKAAQNKHVLFQETAKQLDKPRVVRQEDGVFGTQLRRPHKSLEELVSSEQTLFDKPGSIDFAALAKAAPDSFQHKKTDSFKGFEGAGTAVFKSKNSSGSEVADEGSDDLATHFDSTAEFTPVIPLPELVATQTGEEGQTVLFEQRAKLLRFDPEVKQWKERGVGKMKILHDPVSGTVRFLMRREQVLKVCCNHRLTPDLKLNMSSNSDRAWTWYAQDYSDGSVQNEFFALRFKTPEQALDFKDAVETAQADLLTRGTAADVSITLSDVSTDNNTSYSFSDVSSCNISGVSVTIGHSGATVPLAQLTVFQRKEGTWECQNCYIMNSGNSVECEACLSRRKASITELPTSVATSTTSASAQSTTPSLSEMFRPKPGSWECSGCLVRNSADVKVCPACGGMKPGEEAAQPSSTTGSSGLPSTGFSFGMPKTAAIEAPKFGSTLPNAGFSFGMPATVTETPKFSFGFSGGPSAQNEMASKPAVTFSFGNSNNNQSKSESLFSTPLFGSKAQDSSRSATDLSSAATFTFGGVAAAEKVTSSPAFVFKGPEDGDAGQVLKFEFNFSGVRSPKASPRSPGAGGHAETDGDSDGDGQAEEYNGDESGDGIFFHPVIPLPDKVHVTTGEENETVLYSHRAKLYRFVEGEWKERGIGDVKILSHKETNKVRLLMRREMILKVCLNHLLTPEISFQPKDEKTWLWCAMDFSEGEFIQEKFAIRFKTGDIAQQFKDAIDSVVSEMSPEGTRLSPDADEKKQSADMKGFTFTLPGVASPPSPFTGLSFVGNSPREKSIFGSSVANSKTATPTVKTKDREDDVQVLYEKEVTPEQREAALKLQLPPNFYSYLKAPPCPGCAGCDPEDVQSAAPPTKTVDSAVTFLTPKPEVVTSSSTPSINTAGTAAKFPALGAFSFGGIKATQNGGDGKKEAAPDFLFKEALSFASLATSPGNDGFKKASENFKWAGANTAVFGGKKKQAKSPKQGDGDGGESSEGEGSDEVVVSEDIHFEPVVPMPPLISVRTGEEEEEKVFGERAKLFRFDSDLKEWKERGVGEMKILYHPGRRTYRLLMRREQVHKVVCNQLLSTELSMNPMVTSKQAWVWSAMNLADEYSSPKLEQLAVKFKNVELAQTFKNKMDECIDLVREIKASAVQRPAESTTEQEEEAGGDDDDDDEDETVDDEDYDGEEAYEWEIKFERKAMLCTRGGKVEHWITAGSGTMVVRTHLDSGESRVVLYAATDAEAAFCDAQIEPDTDLEVQGRAAVWTSTDFASGTPTKRQLMAKFYSEADAKDFAAVFETAKDFAKHLEEGEQ